MQLQLLCCRTVLGDQNSVMIASEITEFLARNRDFQPHEKTLIFKYQHSYNTQNLIKIRGLSCLRNRPRIKFVVDAV